MPYTQAMTHGAQSVANTVPLSVFHTTTKDTQLMDYDIPKGAECSRTTATMLGSLILLWFGFCLFFLLRTQRPQTFPPRPQPIPIFRNILHLNLENPINDLKKVE
ncbi:hypothetical protein AAFF_G00227390 [Aldrovandia affinis]|uniref:Uncharacterized protein n=1 Tax=Aldrovandia affinis TaxID=143900 RepID=A0AAD7X1P9_9TELE|nr:hypothetical protein AAFF_G00227390 [Aldrovandia affinis]